MINSKNNARRKKGFGVKILGNILIFDIIHHLSQLSHKILKFIFRLFWNLCHIKNFRIRFFKFFLIIFLLVEYGGKGNKYKLLIIPAAIVLFALTIADARAGQIGVLIMLISFAWMLSRRQSKNSFALKLVVLLFITGIVLIYLLVPSIKDSVILGFNEITNVAKGQELQYSSMGKRVIYYQYYFQIAKDNLLFGLGTGSLQGVNQDIFVQHGIRWDKPHNQFLEWAIQFGIIGLTLILLCWILFVRSFSKKAKEFIIPFTGLMFFSMFFDDTLGTQAGMAIFIGVYMIFLPSNQNNTA
jgi:O-antigen ligase